MTGTNPLTRLREAIAATINDAKIGVTAFPHIPAGAASGPVVFCHIRSDTAVNTSQDQIEVLIDVVLWVPSPNDQAAQQLADDLIVGATSVRALLVAAQPDMRGTASDFHVQSEGESAGTAPLGGVNGWLYRLPITAVLALNT